MHRKLSLIIILLVLCLQPATAAPAGRLKIGAGEWPPFTSEKLVNGGLLNRIVVEAFAAVGIEVEIVFLPWARAFAMAKAGDIDGTCCWFNNDERRNTFLVSPPLYEVQYVFFHRRDLAFHWATFEDLKGMSIGAIHEYYYGETFTEYERSGRIYVERVPSDEINFRKLLAGRIDLYPVASPNAGLALLRELFNTEEQESITYHPRPFIEDPGMHLLLSRNRPEAQRIWDYYVAGLKHLKASGRYTAIIGTIHGLDEPGP